MADELTIRASLNVKGVTAYQSYPTQYIADLTNKKGPSPSAVTVSLSGTDIDLSQLTLPGACFLANCEDPDTTSNSYVEYGIYDPQMNVFYPFGELKPGAIAVFQFSRNFREEWSSIGTGTGTSTDNNTFRMKAYGAPAVVKVDAHDV